MADEQLSRRHWQALDVIAAGPVSMAAIDAHLAPFLAPDRPTAAPVVDDLRARGWVTGAQVPALTAAGEQAHAGLLAKISASRRRVSDGVDAADYETAVRVLRRMAANLGWSGDGRGPDLP